MTALVRLGLRLAGGGGARERGRSLSVAAAAAAGVVVLALTLAVVAAVRTTLGRAYGASELSVLTGGVLVSVGVPVVVLVATAARLSASVRDRRLASLRLIGLPPASTRLLAAVEVGAATLAGALVGAVGFVAFRSVVPSIRVGGLVVTPAVTGLPSVGVVLLAVLVVSVAVAVVPTRHRAGQALASVRAAEERPVPWWRLVPVAVGVALLVTVRLVDTGTGDPSTGPVLALFAGAGLTGLGLLVLLPATVRLLAGALVPVPNATVRLAARRMQAQPAGVQRVVAGLLAALFVIAGARMVLVAFEESDGGYAQARSAVDGGPQPLSVRAPAQSMAEVESALSVHPLVERVSVDQAVSTGCRGARSLCLSAFVGTCAELVEALPGVTGCRDDEAAFLGRDAFVGTAEPGATLTWRSGSRSLTMPTPPTTLAYDGSDQDLAHANVFLPRATPGVERLLHGSRQSLSWSVSAHGGATAAAQLRQALQDAAPQASVVREWRRSDLALVDTMRRGLWLLAGVVVSVGLLSFVIGGIDRALSRRAESARLQMLGTPRRAIVAAQWMEALLPLLVGVPLAALLGSFAGETYLTLGDETTTTPWTGIGTVVALTLLGSVAVAGLTVVAAAPRLRADLIRAE